MLTDDNTEPPPRCESKAGVVDNDQSNYDRPDLIKKENAATRNGLNSVRIGISKTHSTHLMLADTNWTALSTT